MSSGMATAVSSMLSPAPTRSRARLLLDRAHNSGRGFNTQRMKLPSSPDQRGFDPGHTQQQRFSDPPTFYHSFPCSPFLHMDSAAFHSLFSALFLPIPSPLLSPPLAIHGRERPD
ncbi:hypothetical protein BGW80DRAFT_1560440 [Lactifluus volemus]|nr:hypothetical protein BGW80DRAFT_1560440 [Lactifluus volemus]